MRSSLYSLTRPKEWSKGLFWRAFRQRTERQPKNTTQNQKIREKSGRVCSSRNSQRRQRSSSFNFVSCLAFWGADRRPPSASCSSATGTTLLSGLTLKKL